MIAGVAGEGAASLHLGKSAGVTEVGLMREADRKLGRLLNVYILQKMPD